MYVGVNTPYDWYDPTHEELEQLAALDPEMVVVMSHTPAWVLSWMINRCPNVKVFLVRAKTGPANQGTYPDNLLDYKEWESEQSLRECIEYFLSYGITPSVILGNEPDIEMAIAPDDEWAWELEAEAFVRWYTRAFKGVSEAFPEVQIGPAALSQGNQARFAEWYRVWSWLDYDFTTEHAYIGTPPEEWQFRYKQMDRKIPLFITEFNDNGTGRSPTLYADVANWFEATDQSVAGLAFFTLEGGGNTRANRPEWWFLTNQEVDNIASRDWHFNAEFDLRDPYKAKEEKPMNVLEGFVQLWQLNGAFPCYVNDDYTGIFKVWSKNPDIYGSPVGGEFTTDDGRVLQTFTRGVYEWSGGTLVKVDSGF